MSRCQAASGIRLIATISNRYDDFLGVEDAARAPRFNPNFCRIVKESSGSFRTEISPIFGIVSVVY